jgi:hypothetical protein
MFVYPDPSEALVGELGESFKELNYDIKQFMNMILRSEAMFSARAAGKNCITNPLDAYSRILNTVRYPLIPYVHSNSVNNLYSAIIDNRFVSSGEVLLGYPSVFTHDYCGRSEGKDGSTSWLPSHLLVFRVINLTKMLTDFTWNMRNQYDLSEALTLIRSEPEFSDGSAESVIAFFERAFDLRLDEVERGILTEYMNHTRTGAGALVSAPWNPDNQARVREKIAGLMVIMAGFHQATTH